MSLSVRLSEWIYLRYTCQKLRKICHFHKCEMNDLAIHYWCAMILSVFFNIERWSSTSRWLFLSQFEYDQAQMVRFVDNYEKSNCVSSPTGRRSEMMKKPNRFTPNRLITNVEKQIFWRNGIQTAFSCNRTSFAFY